MLLSNILGQVNTLLDWVKTISWLSTGVRIQNRPWNSRSEATLSIITILSLSSVIFEYKHIFHLRRNLLFLVASYTCQLSSFPLEAEFTLNLNVLQDLFLLPKKFLRSCLSLCIMQFPGFPLLPTDFLNSIKSLNHSYKVFILWK